MELSDICQRLAGDTNAPRGRIVTGLSPAGEASARKALGSSFERVRVGDFVSGECFLVMPEALFRDFLEPRFSAVRAQGKTPILTGLDAYLGLLEPESRKRCFAILLRLADRLGKGKLVAILRSTWPEMLTVFTNPSLRGNLWLEGSADSPHPPRISLLPARFAERFGDVGTPPALRDWLRAREDGLNTESESRATVRFNDYDFPGVDLTTVRQVRGDRAFLETFCHFSLPDADEAVLEWILRNTVGLDVEAQLARRFFPEGAPNAGRFALARWEKLEDDAERAVYLALLRRISKEGGYAARALARVAAEHPGDFAPDFRDAWLVPAPADINSPNAAELASERATAIREFGVSRTEVTAAQEAMIAASTAVPDSRLAPWMELGLVCEQREWVRRFMAGQSEAVKRSTWLAAYLGDVGTGCPTADRYLHDYRRRKAENRIDPSACENAALAEFPIVDLEHRASALGSFKSDMGAFVLVVDGMGAEWIPFLVGRANANRIQVREAKCVSGNLPTSTEFNRVISSIIPAEPDATPEFPDDSRCEKIGDLDDVFHSAEMDSAAGFSEEMRIVEEVVLARIRNLLKKWERIVLTSDHGASRLAILAYESGLSGEGIAPDKEQSLSCVTVDDWRHAEKPEDKIVDDSRFEVSGDGRHLCVKGYRRFSRQGSPGFERHGGASLEERLVPFVVFGRKYEGDFVQPESLSAPTSNEGQIEVVKDFDEL